MHRRHAAFTNDPITNFRGQWGTRKRTEAARDRLRRSAGGDRNVAEFKLLPMAPSYEPRISAASRCRPADHGGASEQRAESMTRRLFITTDCEKAITTATSEDVTRRSFLAAAARLFCNRLRVRSLAGAFQPSSKIASS